jgi:HK97 family phage prohead protease
VTTLELFTGGALTAAVYQAEPGEPNHRVAEGILVPYGQPGRTNLGPKRIARGALRLVAEAPVVGLYGHDRERSVSRLIASEDRAEGLWGRLRIAETPTGDLLLAELRGGVRDGLSVELSDLVLDASDPNLVTSARLDAVAHVPLPAYDTARVSALAATQHAPTGEPSVTAPAP